MIGRGTAASTSKRNTGRNTSRVDASAVDTQENYMNMDLDDDEPNVLHHMGTKTMEEILADVLRLENFNLKQSSTSGDNSFLKFGNSVISKPSILKKEKMDTSLDMDPRLRNWNRVLNQRQRIQERIERQTGKRAEDVLFNRPTTIDDASKKMILRILDTADRSRPTDQVKEKAMMRSLKARMDPESCCEIKELFLAKPKIQVVEFVGLPQVTQKEVASINVPPDAPESQWQRSEVLSKHLEDQKGSIQRVLEFAPDIHKLQVLPTYTVPISETPVITKLAEADILPLSGDSTVEEEEEETDRDLEPTFVEGEEEALSKEPETAPAVKEKPAYNVEVNDLDPFQDIEAVMINGILYDYDNSNKTTGKNIQLDLKCDPHQRVLKTLLDIQNLSKKLVNVHWQPRNRIRTDRVPMNSELIFDRREFILEPQERRIVRVMFQPQHVGLYTLRYSLSIVRTPFCNGRRLEVIMKGLCTMPEVYKRRLEKHKQVPVQKQQEQQARELLNLHATLAPIIENPTLLCPYERALDEREVFNAQNLNHRCERYEDLEALKALYSVAKKPRDRPWDLSLDSLRKLISKQENRLMREHLHLQMIRMLEPIKCNRCEALTKLDHNPERERSCFIYVRGTICSAVDEWEKMALGLDDQFFKLELLRVLDERSGRQDRLLRDEEITQDSQTSPEMISKMIPSDYPKSSNEEEDIAMMVSKRLKTSKYLWDALYMHTYSLLCDVAEDIVSVIESTTLL